MDSVTEIAGKLRATLESRIGQEFDGECHLTEEEARELIMLLAALAQSPPSEENNMTSEAHKLRKAAKFCRERAMEHIAGMDDLGFDYERADSLVRCAELLRAAETFEGRANMVTLFRGEEVES